MICSECVCSSSFIGADFPDFLRSEIHVARKEHICCECGRRIPVGESYELVVGKWDGIFCTFKTCYSCKAIRDTLFCDGYTYGGIFSDLREYLYSVDMSYDLLDCIAILPERARNDILQILQERLV